ncbi:MAG: PKD domain-containing protein [Planctomycetota bacterium]
MRAHLLTPLTAFVLLIASAALGQIAIPPGFPTASTTGLAGVGLTVNDLTPTSGRTITTDGTVIDMEDISGTINIQANNVTIKRCRIHNYAWYAVRVYSGYTGTVIEDCLLPGSQGSANVTGSYTTVRRCDVAGDHDGLKIGSGCLFEDNYIHDQYKDAESHNDGMQCSGGSHWTLRGNTIQGPYQQSTSAIIIKSDLGTIDDGLIENNFLSGGSYTFYHRTGSEGTPTNIRLLYNTFEKDSYLYGHASINGTPYFEGNIFHTGEAIPENPPVGNQPPVADAGTDQTVTDSDDDGSEDVTLDGSSSYDSDGTISSYVWDEGGTQIATGATPTVSFAVGTHTVNLTVTDDDSATDSDSVVITVNAGGTGGGEIYTINCHTNDQVVRSDGTFKWVGQDNLRVGGGVADADGAAVLPFQLPTLAAGETIATANLDINLEKIQHSPSGNVDLYGLGWRSSSGVLVGDFYQGAYDGDSTDAWALQDDFATLATPSGNVATDATGDANLASYVADQYAAGAQGGDYVFLRLNPDIADVEDYWYWVFTSANGSPVPVLTIETSDTSSVTSDTTWQNFAIDTQAGQFTFEFDAVPNNAGMDGITGMCSGVADFWSDVACIARFAEGGQIDVRNGGAYGADTALNYVAGTTYHFRMVIDVPNHTYSVYVTPDGQSEVTLATDYAFRTEQAGVTSLDHWVLNATYEGDSHTVSNVEVTEIVNTPPVADAGVDQTVTDSDGDGSAAVTLDGSGSSDADGTIVSYVWEEDGSQIATGSNPSVTMDVRVHTVDLTVTDDDGATDSDLVVITVVSRTLTSSTSSQDWPASALPTQTGTFTCEFDAVPNDNGIDGVTGLSSGPGDWWDELACIVRFNTSGTIDVRNGGSYAADTTLAYSSGTTYHVRMVVDIPNHTYSVYVTPDGQSEVTLATDYAFRSEQASVTSLDHWTLNATNSVGTHTVSNLTLTE